MRPRAEQRRLGLDLNNEASRKLGRLVRKRALDKGKSKHDKEELDNAYDIMAQLSVAMLWRSHNKADCKPPIG